jgi:hypothetical protein
MKLQAATRLQVTAATGDAKAFREALLAVSKQIEQAQQLVVDKKVKQAKTLMKSVLTVVDKGLKRSMRNKASSDSEIEINSLDKERYLYGGVEWQIAEGPNRKHVSCEFYFGELHDKGRVWLDLGSSLYTEYKFELGAFDLAKYQAFVNKAVNEFEAKGLA